MPQGPSTEPGQTRTLQTARAQRGRRWPHSHAGARLHGTALGPAPAREGGGWESSERPPPEPGERKHQIKSEGNVWKERSAETPETGSSTKEQNKKRNSKTQRPWQPRTDRRCGRGGRRPASGEEDSVPAAGARALNEAETQECWHRL